MAKSGWWKDKFLSAMVPTGMEDARIATSEWSPASTCQPRPPGRSSRSRLCNLAFPPRLEAARQRHSKSILCRPPELRCRPLSELWSTPAQQIAPRAVAYRKASQRECASQPDRNRQPGLDARGELLSACAYCRHERDPHGCFRDASVDVRPGTTARVPGRAQLQSTISGIRRVNTDAVGKQ